MCSEVFQKLFVCNRRLFRPILKGGKIFPVFPECHPDSIIDEI
jgi:hypothetical protein